MNIPLPTLGIDLRSDEGKMPAGTVRTAVNVEIESSGQFRRRRGWKPVQGGNGWASLFSWCDELIAQKDAAVFRMNPETREMAKICDLDSDHPVSYGEYNGFLYFCQPSGVWRLGRSGDARAVGVRLPPTLPNLQETQAGTLDSGAYTVAVSVVDEFGEESPAVIIGSASSNAGLRLLNMQVMMGFRWRIYITPPNGDVLYLAEEIDAVWQQYDVSVYPGGAPCVTAHREILLGGHILRGWMGRIYVAAGSNLWYSDALRPHLFDRRSNFVQFVGKIRFIEFVAGGAYVADDRGVWWLSGNDPTSWVAEMVSKSLAVGQSSILLAGQRLGVDGGGRSTREVAIWLSEDGHMTGNSQGEVLAINSDRIRLDPSISGKTVFVERDGLSQVVTLTAAAGPTHVFGAAVDKHCRIGEDDD